MADGLEFINLPEFEARATAAIEALKLEGNARLEGVGEKVAETARTLAPVGSGDEDTPGELRDSIAVHRDGETIEVGAFGVRYAAFVEYGTSKMVARPFLRPALAEAHRLLEG